MEVLVASSWESKHLPGYTAQLLRSTISRPQLKSLPCFSTVCVTWTQSPKLSGQVPQQGNELRVSGAPPNNDNDCMTWSIYPHCDHLPQSSLIYSNLASISACPFNTESWVLPFPRRWSTHSGLGSGALDALGLPHDGCPPALARSQYLYLLLPDHSLPVRVPTPGYLTLTPGNHWHCVLDISQLSMLSSASFTSVCQEVSGRHLSTRGHQCSLPPYAPSSHDLHLFLSNSQLPCDVCQPYLQHWHLGVLTPYLPKHSSPGHAGPSPVQALPHTSCQQKVSPSCCRHFL